MKLVRGEHVQRATGIGTLKPTTSTLPKCVDAVATVAGPVGGVLVTGVAQEAELAWALTGALNSRGHGKEAECEQGGCGRAHNNPSEPARQHHHDLQKPSRLGDPSRIYQIPFLLRTKPDPLDR